MCIRDSSKVLRNFLFELLHSLDKGSKESKNIVGCFSLPINYDYTHQVFFLDEIVAINIFQIFKAFSIHYQKGVEKAEAKGKNLLVGLLNKDLQIDDAGK